MNQEVFKWIPLNHYFSKRLPLP